MLLKIDDLKSPCAATIIDGRRNRSWCVAPPPDQVMIVATDLEALMPTTDTADWSRAEPGSVLATADDYGELVAALRKRKAALSLSGAEIEQRTGLAAGYVAKLLGPSRVKVAGPLSLGLMLQTLGLRLAVIAGEAARPGLPKGNQQAGG